MLMCVHTCAFLCFSDPTPRFQLAYTYLLPSSNQKGISSEMRLQYLLYIARPGNQSNKNNTRYKIDEIDGVECFAKIHNMIKQQSGAMHTARWPASGGERGGGESAQNKSGHAHPPDDNPSEPT